MEKDYSLEVKKCWNLCPYIYILCSSWCALQTVRHFLKLLPVSIVSESLFIYDMTSALADYKMLKAKIHSFLKQCLRNFHFIKTRYFSQNLSISCSIKGPCFKKPKIMHNTVLKMDFSRSRYVFQNLNANYQDENSSNLTSPL